MTQATDVFLLPDAGPLITLAYADALNLLLKPKWTVALVDMVLHEVTRQQTPTSEKLAQWVQKLAIPVLPTKIYKHHQKALKNRSAPPKRSNLGELAIQEMMNHLALEPLQKTSVFLFEDHKIARTCFLVPDNCRKVSTRAFLIFLEQKGWCTSAAEIERKAIQAGRTFSKLRFPA
jgi:hypothetical protein